MNTCTVIVPSYLEPGAAETEIRNAREKAADKTLALYRKMIELALHRLAPAIPQHLAETAGARVRGSSIDANLLPGQTYQWLLELHTVIRRIARRTYPEKLKKHLPGLCLPQLDHFFTLYPPTPGERKAAALATSQKHLDLD